MLGRNSSLGLRAAIGALWFMAWCGADTAQGVPPPAVSVFPGSTRHVTVRGVYIGRVSAIN